jgi:hypothetical protein
MAEKIDMTKLIAKFAKLSGKDLETEYFALRRGVRVNVYNTLNPEQRQHLDPIIYARRGIVGKEDGHLIFTKEEKLRQRKFRKAKVDLLEARLRDAKADAKKHGKDVS